MKQHQIYKAFIRHTPVISPVKIYVYFILLAGVLLFNSSAMMPVLSTAYIDELLFIYLFYLLVFYYLLPKFYLDYQLPYSWKKQLIIGGILLFYLTGMVLQDLSHNKPANIEMLYRSHSPSILITKGIGVILIGVAEEYMFRAVLFKQLVKHTRKITFSMLLCSLIFTIAHIPQYLNLSTDFDWISHQLILAFIFSLIMCEVYFTSDSLFLVAALHALVDVKPVFFAQSGIAITTYESAVLILLIVTPILLRLHWLHKKITRNNLYNSTDHGNSTLE